MIDNLKRLLRIVTSNDATKSWGYPSWMLTEFFDDNQNIISKPVSEWIRETVCDALKWRCDAKHAIEESTYCLFIRSFGAYYENGQLHPGTFLSCFPLVKRIALMGYGLVMILPIFQIGKESRKGEFGSPYALLNEYTIDDFLVTQYFVGCTAEDQFAAFCELLNCYGLELIVDIPFRLAARDSKLTLVHPEWFYWIKTNSPFRYPSDGMTQEAYREQFVSSPTVADFSDFLTQTSCTTFLKWCKNNLGIITMPAFSDVPDDPQEPWWDVTYFRCLENRPEWFDYKDITPPGLVAPLRQRMQNLVEFQSKFGFRGYRVDGAHALGIQTLTALRNGLQNDILLLGEAFDTRQITDLEIAGFDAVTGNVWGVIDHLGEEAMPNLLETYAHSIALPYLGALETHDSPRVSRWISSSQVIAAHVIASCLPGAMPFCVAGQEVGDSYPMNLGYGMDNRHYSRLPLFDLVPLRIGTTLRLSWIACQLSLLLWRGLGRQRTIDTAVPGVARFLGECTVLVNCTGQDRAVDHHISLLMIIDQNGVANVIKDNASVLLPSFAVGVTGNDALIHSLLRCCS